jgi:hypothetical protein
MALHSTIKINGSPIGLFIATRIDPVETTPTADTVCTYDVEIVDRDGRWRGAVKHRYGDEAWSLMLGALSARARVRDLS